MVLQSLLKRHVCRTWNRISTTNYNFCRQQDGTWSLKMVECIENILWTTTECMLPNRKPKFVVCIMSICTSVYLTYMKWYSLSLSMGWSETASSSLASPTSLHKFPVNYHLLMVMYGTALFWPTSVIQCKNINHCSLLVLLDLW